jgi:hypothetical protein
MASQPLHARLYIWTLLGVLALVMAISFVKTVVEPGRASFDEKRRLAQWPRFPATLSEWKELPPQLEAFCNDNFGFRKILMHFDRKIDAFFLGRSPTSTVLIGKNDWLYFTGERSIELYRNAIPMSETRLESWRKELSRRQAALGSLGTGYAFIAAPDKHSVYPEHMPTYYYKARPFSQYDQLMEMTSRNGIRFMGLRDVLLDNKPLGNMYHRDDTHWTELGAYIGYSSIMASINATLNAPVAVLSIGDFRVAPLAKQGDLARMAMLARREDAPQLVSDRLACHPQITETRSDVFGSKGLQRFRCEGSTKKLLIFHDSFFEALQPFLSQSFGEIVAISYHPKTEELLEFARSEHFDYVLEERVERQLNAEP